MWSHDVGNGMYLEVNQSNGDLYLNVPLGSYATPIGPLDVNSPTTPSSPARSA